MQKKTIKHYFVLILKGVGMGAANVIPGVSGGTIALITGIFEELIDSIKSFDIKAVKLLFSGKFKEFANHINLGFLIAVFLGVAISIVSLARILDYLFINYPIYIWAFFFGLILASVYFVGRTISKWNFSVVLFFILGAVSALFISILKPATENDQFLYLVICGVVAICSMILPGLSGSFVLILLGNYQLVFINAVNNARIEILLPVVIGAGVGLIMFSHLLSWVYKKFRDQTISILTGFILGSLAILWPWKTSFDIEGNVLPINKMGAFVDASGAIIQEEVKVSSYNQILPQAFDSAVMVAIILVLAGFISIWLIEKFAGNLQETES